ncbi:MAG: 8-amino-7-oxononanoate synthase [Phycisphaerales bacterium]|jgi:8-amino-7-oxononanoate synthase
MGPPVTNSTSTSAHIDGRPLVTFGGCNYLGLAHHPRLLHAASLAAERYGLTTSASRTTTGDTDLHHELERLLADWFSREAALLAPEGMLANLVACQAAAALGIRHALIDDRAHRSLRVAAVAAGLEITSFPHGQRPETAALARTNTPCIILTDGVFTATGEIANLKALAESLPTPESVLLVDDCHGFPVLAGGHGTAAHAGLTDPRVWITTSLAKGLGAGGGVFLAPKRVIDVACAHASAFICTTPPSPALAGAAVEAIALLETEPDRVARLSTNAARIAAGLETLGLNPGSPLTPIFSFDFGTADLSSFETHMQIAGFSVPVMSYPGGRTDRYVRLTVNADHTEAQIDGVLAAIGAFIPMAVPS